MISQFCRMGANLSEWAAYIQQQRINFEKNGLNSWIANLNPSFSDTFIHASRNFLIEYYYPETTELGFQRWGFKEVRYGAPEAQFLFRCFPDSRLLFLLRHPKDALASAAATDWYSKIGYAEGVINQWSRNVSTVLNMQDERIQFMKYETLVNNTEEAITLIAKHIGVSAEKFDPNMLSFRFRASNKPPNLGNSELQVLDSPKLLKLARKVGY